MNINCKIVAFAYFFENLSPATKELSSTETDGCWGLVGERYAVLSPSSSLVHLRRPSTLWNLYRSVAWAMAGGRSSPTLIRYSWVYFLWSDSEEQEIPPLAARLWGDDCWGLLPRPMPRRRSRVTVDGAADGVVEPGRLDSKSSCTIFSSTTAYIIVGQPSATLSSSSTSNPMYSPISNSSKSSLSRWWSSLGTRLPGVGRVGWQIWSGDCWIDKVCDWLSTSVDMKEKDPLFI